MNWFIDLAWWWKIAIFWGYFIIGFAFDLIQQKVFDWSSNEPTPVLWFLWPLALLAILALLPFALLSKIFGKI